MPCRVVQMQDGGKEPRCGQRWGRGGDGLRAEHRAGHGFVRRLGRVGLMWGRAWVPSPAPRCLVSVVAHAHYAEVDEGRCGDKFVGRKIRP